MRYNVSQDDGLFDHNAGIFVWVGDKGMESTLVHNNTIWSTKGSAVAYGISQKLEGPLPDLPFYNNIFVSQGPQVFRRGEGSGKLGRFLGNLYWAMGERGFRVDGFKSLQEWAAASGQETIDGRLVGLFADPALPRSGPAMLTSPADLASARGVPAGQGLAGRRRRARLAEGLRHRSRPRGLLRQSSAVGRPALDRRPRGPGKAIEGRSPTFVRRSTRTGGST